tara:strand:- start:452 stop:2941 length:2490 start_codon:yes stop_codon:yes gene_type:complete
MVSKKDVNLKRLLSALQENKTLDIDKNTVADLAATWNATGKTKITTFLNNNIYNKEEMPYGRMTLRQFMTPSEGTNISPFEELKGYIEKEIEANPTARTARLKDYQKNVRFMYGQLLRPYLENIGSNLDFLNFIPSAEKGDLQSIKILGEEAAKEQSTIGVTFLKNNYGKFFQKLEEFINPLVNVDLIPESNAIVTGVNTGFRPNTILGLTLQEYDPAGQSVYIDPNDFTKQNKIIYAELLDQAGGLEKLTEQGKIIEKSGGRGLGKAGSRGSLIPLSVPLNDEASSAIERQIALNNQNPIYIQKYGTNNPKAPIFIKADGSKVNTTSVNTVLQNIVLDIDNVSNPSDYLIYDHNLKIKLPSFHPSKEVIVDALMNQRGLSESQAKAQAKITKTGYSLLRNVHTVVSDSQDIPRKYIDFVQGRGISPETFSAGAQGYATRVPGEFSQQERKHVNTVSNFFRESNNNIPIISGTRSSFTPELEGTHSIAQDNIVQKKKILSDDLLKPMQKKLSKVKKEGVEYLMHTLPNIDITKAEQISNEFFNSKVDLDNFKSMGSWNEFLSNKENINNLPFQQYSDKLKPIFNNFMALTRVGSKSKKALNTLFPDNQNLEITPLKGRFYYGEDPPELAGIDPSDTKAQGEAIDKLGQKKSTQVMFDFSHPDVKKGIKKGAVGLIGGGIGLAAHAVDAATNVSEIGGKYANIPAEDMLSSDLLGAMESGARMGDTGELMDYGPELDKRFAAQKQQRQMFDESEDSVAGRLRGFAKAREREQGYYSADPKFDVSLTEENVGRAKQAYGIYTEDEEEGRRFLESNMSDQMNEVLRNPEFRR